MCFFVINYLSDCLENYGFVLLENIGWTGHFIKCPLWAVRISLMPCPSIGPKWFSWTVQIILVKYQSFWSGPTHFGQVQIIKINPEKSNLTLTKMLWTRPKQFGPDQNNLFLYKTIWMVQNNFGPIEGQGINQYLLT